MPEHSFPCSVPGRLRNTDLFATTTGIFTGGFAISVVFVVVSAAIVAGATIVASVVVGAAIVVAFVAGSTTIVAVAIVVAGFASAAGDDRALYRSGARAVITVPLIGVTNEGCLHARYPKIRHTHRPTDGSGG